MEIKILIMLLLVQCSTCDNTESPHELKTYDDENQNDSLEKLKPKVEEPKLQIPPVKYIKNQNPIVRTNKPVIPNASTRRNSVEINQIPMLKLSAQPKIKVKPEIVRTKTVVPVVLQTHSNIKPPVMHSKILPGEIKTNSQTHDQEHVNTSDNNLDGGNSQDLRDHDHDFHSYFQGKYAQTHPKKETKDKKDKVTFYEEDSDDNVEANVPANNICTDADDTKIIKDNTKLNSDQKNATDTKPEIEENAKNKTKLVKTMDIERNNCKLADLLLEGLSTNNKTNQTNKVGMPTESENDKRKENKTEDFPRENDLKLLSVKSPITVKHEPRKKLMETHVSVSQPDICDKINNNDIIIINQDVNEVIQKYKPPCGTNNELYTDINYSPEVYQDNNNDIPKFEILKYVPPQPNSPQGYFTNIQVPARRNWNQKNYVTYIKPDIVPAPRLLYNGNNYGNRKPNHLFTPPPYKYPFEDQLQDIVCSSKGGKKYLTDNIGLVKTTIMPNPPYNDFKTYKSQAKTITSYDPLNCYKYDEVVGPNDDDYKIWRSWRTTNFILKNLNTKAILQNEAKRKHSMNTSI